MYLARSTRSGKSQELFETVEVPIPGARRSRADVSSLIRTTKHRLLMRCSQNRLLEDLRQHYTFDFDSTFYRYSVHNCTTGLNSFADVRKA